MAFLSAVRVDTDGTVTDLLLPDATDPRHRAVLAEQVGGDVEYAHYGRRTEGGVLAVAVVVGEWSMRDAPPNPHVTRIVEAVRGGPLSYRLHGPAVLTGYQPRSGDLTDLPAAARLLLPAAIGGAR